MSSESGFTGEVVKYDSNSVTPDHTQQSSPVCVVQADITSFRTFTCFPKLPAELRLRIWEAALPGPRVMRIRMKFDAIGSSRISRFLSSHPPPIGLRVCRESRLEALKIYELAFPHNTTPARTYVNYELDTLVLDTFGTYLPKSRKDDRTPSKNVLLHNEYKKVRSIVIDERFVWLNRRLFSKEEFPSLETISLIPSRSSIKAFKKPCWDVEECDAPKEPEASQRVVQLTEAWLRKMKSSNRPNLKIRFVRVVEGSGGKKTRDEKVDAKEVTESG